MSQVEEVYFANSMNSHGTYGTKTSTGNSRVYNCKHCQRAFTREEHLSRHILLTHNKLKPFICGICLRPFLRRDLLLRHAKNLHQGSEMAVSRIRKLYQKTEDGKGDNDENGNDENDDIDENDDLKDGYSDTERLKDYSDSERPPDTLPGKLSKMSVNMLVS